MTHTLFDAYRHRLVGLPISHVWPGYGTALFLEFGELTPYTKRDGSPGEPGGQYSIMIQWAWRIEDKTSILCGSDNDEGERTANRARLVGRTVEEIALVGRLPELSVSLSGELYVASFNTLDGPGWTIFDNRPVRRWIKFEQGRIVEEKETEDEAAHRRGKLK